MHSAAPSHLGSAPSSSRRLINSRNDHRIKRIRFLQERGKRDQTGLFFIEGTRFVLQALESGAQIETLLVAPDLLVHPFGKKLAREHRRTGLDTLEVTPEVFHSVALSDEPQGIGAVVRQNWTLLQDADPSHGLCWIALNALQSPGNLGTILRTSDAVGAVGLIVIGDTIDPYDPATVRATMGAFFSQQFVRASLSNFLKWKRHHGCALVGTSPSATLDYQEAPYPSPLVLWMGGERKGLAVEHQGLCDVMVRIPMVGRSDSLNLGIATGVMLYEVFNQRRSGVNRSHA